MIERLQAKAVKVTASANPLAESRATPPTSRAEVEGSHVIMISQPEAVTEVVMETVAAVG